MDAGQITSIVIFLVALAIIVSEKVHRSLVAVSSAVLILMLGIMPFDEALKCVDFNTLGVLFGMMMFVGVVKESGLFEFLAVKCVHLSKGNPWRIMLLFAILTACLSAFLDNVTTVLLVGPMTLNLCKLLKVNPIPYLLVEIMSSNIGGTATLIGDPPNIMIGSAAGFNFMDFVMVDTPAVLIIMVAVLIVFYSIYGRKISVGPDQVTEVLTLDPASYIKNRKLLHISLVMIVVVVVGFVCHGVLHWESSVIALGAAAIIMLISRVPITEVLPQVEWTTLVFFGGIFIVVGAMTYTGVIDMFAGWLISLTGGDTFMTMLVLMFASAIVSAFLDNIPFVATMIPVLTAMQATGMDVSPLWWAVSLGACLGGNGTLIGASPNVVLSDISSRNGYPITFAQYFKIGFPIMLMTAVIAGLYLVVRFPPV